MPQFPNQRASDNEFSPVPWKRRGLKGFKRLEDQRFRQRNTNSTQEYVIIKRLHRATRIFPIKSFLLAKAKKELVFLLKASV